jgi:hypothetical protein
MASPSRPRILKRRLADALLPWVMGNATPWPSLHDALKHERQRIAELESYADSLRLGWTHANKELTLTRIRLGKEEAKANKWIQAFNSLEKPVTQHIDNCMDADDLERAHRAVMKRYGP